MAKTPLLMENKTRALLPEESHIGTDKAFMFQFVHRFAADKDVDAAPGLCTNGAPLRRYNLVRREKIQNKEGASAIYQYPLHLRPFLWTSPLP